MNFVCLHLVKLGKVLSEVASHDEKWKNVPAGRGMPLREKGNNTVVCVVFFIEHFVFFGCASFYVWR